MENCNQFRIYKHNFLLERSKEYSFKKYGYSPVKNVKKMQGTRFELTFNVKKHGFY